MFKNQGLHIFLVLVILYIAVWIWNVHPSMHQGQLWDWPTQQWLFCAILTSLLHHFYVWLSWRGELKHKIMTRLLGTYALTIHAIIFFTLVLLRPLLIALVAVSNSQSIYIAQPWYFILLAVLFIPWAYTMYSVAKYFGFKRATGADHFDPAYRKMGLVKEGSFKYCCNSMYIFGLLIFWIIGIAFESSAALLAAGYHYAAIWAHYYCLEKPDLETIYGEN
jgi:hypothetical protein